MATTTPEGGSWGYNPPIPGKVGHTTGVYVPIHSFRTVVWFFTSHQEPDKWKCCETGRTVFRPYPRRLESLTVWRCYFLLSYWNPDCWFRAGLNPGPPAYQTGALLTACGGWVRITFAKLYTLPTTAIRVVGEYSRLSPLEGGGRAKDKMYISGKKN